MRRFSLALMALFCAMASSWAQNKYEREFRILKKQFPPNALELIDEKLQDAKRIRFYKEIDSAKISFEAKFKKDRLWYSVEFDEEGTLEDVEILIKQTDVPNDAWAQLNTYLGKRFKKFKIKRIQQQYPLQKGKSVEETVKNAFQNLLLPSLRYELIVGGKNEDGYGQYEVLFDANGLFLTIRKSLPPNYDHVLY